MDIQKQLDEARIREARYNSKYKDILLSEEKPQYLKEGNLDKLNYGYKIRALIKVDVVTWRKIINTGERRRIGCVGSVE